jgi:hypothetical protein
MLVGAPSFGGWVLSACGALGTIVGAFGYGKCPSLSVQPRASMLSASVHGFMRYFASQASCKRQLVRNNALN